MENNMERIAVKSSNILLVGYDKDKKHLEVDFKQGGRYRYLNVDNEVYMDMMQSKSVGRFFHANVKAVFD